MSTRRAFDEPPLILDAGPLTIDEVADVAEGGRRVRIGPRGSEALQGCHEALQRALGLDAAIYGVNTGFGSLARKRIAPDELEQVQHNLIRSHAAGAGDPLPVADVRAMLLILAASLCRGHSGVRPVVAETIAAFLNAGVTPIVPERGSVGASGDLAPLAHAGLALIGEGACLGRTGATLEGEAACREAGVAPLRLGPKEGLALINGTHLMAARASLLLMRLERVIDGAVRATAMSMDACKATTAFLDPRVHDLRRQPMQARAARALEGLLKGSEIVPSHAENDPRVQDPYSFRCAPVVLGACIEQIRHAQGVVERELDGVTDNPLIFPDASTGGAERLVVSAGNFHGMPLALALDGIATALAPLGSISERRVYYTLAATDPEANLTPHLSPHPGLESGLMITQYTAAACVNELVGLATPACVANVPTCAGMEDFNSFGPASASKAIRAAALVRTVVAIELLCACEGLEHHRPLRSGRAVEATREAIRGVVPAFTTDRSPAPAIAAIEGLLEEGVLLRLGNTLDWRGVR